VTRPDVGRVDVDLSNVQRRPCARQSDHEVNDGTDRVCAAKIVIKPQVINPPASQPFQQVKCLQG